MLFNFDPTNLPKKAKLYLCKPNRQVISRLKSAFNTTFIPRLGAMSELSFSLPTKIKKEHTLIDNPDLDKIKDRYTVKIEYNNSTTWFIINQITDSMDSDSKEVHAFSLEHEISDKTIRLYTSKNAQNEESPINATQAITNALSKTIWSVGSVDADFDIKYRSFEVSSKSALDFLYEIATTFGGILVFDTENRKVNLYQPDSIGLNKGLKFSYGKLLNNVQLTKSSDEMVTRLRVYGRNGLSIAEVNPIGSDYIEDFSYFKTLDYMSQGLIDAQNAYESLIESNKNTFSSLLSQLDIKQTLLTQQQTELSDLQMTMNQILNAIDVAQSTNQPTTDLFTQKADQQALIDAKNTEISTTQSEIDSINTERQSLKNLLSLENNFTAEQIKERNLFEIEKSISNDSYTKAQDLYDYAVAQFQKIKSPQIVATVDIVNFLEILEEQRNWDKLSLGDIVTIKYDNLNIYIQAKIIEMSFNFESGTIQLTIANEKDKKDFRKDLYKSVSTSNSVDMSKYKWETAYQKSTEVQQVLDNVWDATKRQINSGVNQTVTVNSRGITIKDSTDSNKFIRMLNSVIGLSSDGGNTFKTAITPSGIVGERIKFKLIRL